MDETMMRRVYCLCLYMTGQPEEALRLARTALADPVPLGAAVRLLRRASCPPGDPPQGLDRALMALPARERLALLLSDAAGVDFAQAAAWMEISPQDFLALRHRARRRLLGGRDCAKALEKVQ